MIVICDCLQPQGSLALAPVSGFRVFAEKYEHYVPALRDAAGITRRSVVAV